MELAWNPAADLWPLWGIAVAVGVLLTLVLEFRRASRWPWLRRLATLVLWGAVLLWGLRPQLSTTAPGGRIAWVTQALPDSALFSFLDAHPVQEIWETEPGLVNGGKVPVSYVPHGYYRPTAHWDSLFVLGDGLAFDRTGLDSLGGWRYVSSAELGAPSEHRLLALNYDGFPQVGRQVTLQATVQLPDGGGSVRWLSPAGPLDSTEYTEAGTYEANSSFFAPLAGQFMYEVEVNTPQDTLTFPVPLSVQPRQALNILMLSGFPTFEHRTLKNWLGEEGHRVAVRSQIAAERFRTEFINRPQQSLGRLTPRLLEDFELVMIDVAVLESLTRAEWEALTQALDLGTLSLWLQPTGDLTASAFPRALRSRMRVPLPTSRAETYTVPKTTFTTEQAGEVAVVDYPLAQAGYSSSGDPTFVGFALNAVNNLYLHRAADTYRWVLAGNTELYSRYWAYYLNAAAGARRATVQWQPNQTPALAGWPNTTPLYVQEGTPHGVMLRLDAPAEPLPLVQDLYEPTRWRAQWQSGTPGWVGLALKEPAADTLWTYVLPDSALIAYQQALRVRGYAEGPKPAHAGQTSTATVLTPISPWWFWGLALLCLTFLWVEPKL